MVGPTAAELDSIKELIQFDHEYFKSPTQSTPKTSVPAPSQVADDKEEVKVQIMKVLQDKVAIAPKQKPVTFTTANGSDHGSNGQLVSIVSPNLKRGSGSLASRKRASCTVTIPQVQQIPAGEAIPDTLDQVEPLDLSTPTSDPEGFNLNLSEVDLTALTDSLEQLIDMDSLLESDTNGSGTEVSGGSVCMESLVAEVDEPAPKRCRLQPTLNISDHQDNSFAVKKEESLNINEAMNISQSKPKIESLDIPSMWDETTILPTSPVHGLTPDFSFGSDFQSSRQNLSSGYGSDFSDLGSPVSDNSSSLLGECDSVWQESFTELFPSLI